MVNFFSKEDERRIIEAIREAEGRTSGEIRVHLEPKVNGDPLEAAAAVFHRLKMDRTAERNGVLIFLVPKEHKFAIFGDKGIHEKVPPGFWEEVRDIMREHFRQGRFADGVCEGIRRAGEKLATYFPRKDDDINELTDEISYG
ncbi:MAG: TPM domain-containing protein [Bacteroidetes bacterium]|nr:MAG: TPM domain-containing protein [Bacteroidota bacterium]